MSGFPRSVVLTLVALACAGAPTRAQNRLTPDLSGIPAEKLGAIREHLRASRTAEVMVESVEASLASERAMSPEVPAVFWDEFAARLVTDVDRFVEALIPVYDATFTLEELEALTAFYRSPLGQRLIETSTALALESAALGEQWGAIVGAEVMLDLANRGIVMPN